MAFQESTTGFSGSLSDGIARASLGLGLREPVELPIAPQTSNDPDATFINRTVPWQNHHPHHVITFAAGGKKNVTDKILTIEGFPDKLSPQEVYHMAKKQGHKGAALAYAEYIFDSNPEMAQNLIPRHSEQPPLILPVTGMERMENGVYNHNAIPEAFAIILSQRTGWKVLGEGSADQVIQYTKAGRTGASKLDRFIKQAYFKGKIERDRDYIIVDDHVTNGGTLRNLLDFIEVNGGRVVGAAALIRGGQDNSLRPTDKIINRVRRMVGYNNFEALHQRLFSRPSSEMRFTAGELSSIKVIFEEEFMPGFRSEHAAANLALAARGRKERPLPRDGKELQDKFFEYLTVELTHGAQTRTQDVKNFVSTAAETCPRAAPINSRGGIAPSPVEPRFDGALPGHTPEAPPRPQTVRSLPTAGAAPVEASHLRHG